MKVTISADNLAGYTGKRGNMFVEYSDARDPESDIVLVPYLDSPVEYRQAYQPKVRLYQHTVRAIAKRFGVSENDVEFVSPYRARDIVAKNAL